MLHDMKDIENTHDFRENISLLIPKFGFTVHNTNDCLVTVWIPLICFMTQPGKCRILGVQCTPIDLASQICSKSFILWLGTVALTLLTVKIV